MDDEARPRTRRAAEAPRNKQRRRRAATDGGRRPATCTTRPPAPRRLRREHAISFVIPARPGGRAYAARRGQMGRLAATPQPAGRIGRARCSWIVALPLLRLTVWRTSWTRLSKGASPDGPLQAARRCYLAAAAGKGETVSVFKARRGSYKKDARPHGGTSRTIEVAPPSPGSETTRRPSSRTRCPSRPRRLYYIWPSSLSIREKCALHWPRIEATVSP